MAGARGTHTGELMGIPPTGKKVEYSAIDIFRNVGDRALGQWAVPLIWEVLLRLDMTGVSG